MSIETKAVAVSDREIEYVPFGAADKIKLSVNMVKQFIAVPTRSGKLPNDRDCIKFLMLCKGKRANPFEGDCYLIGYDNKDGSATFSMVSGVELFLKRAEQSDDYDGYESGVVVMNQGVNAMEYRPGSLVLPGETLVGGWCKVYRKGRAKPIEIVVDFNVYNSGRSRWEKDPGGMIEKVAISQGHRKAYPTALGGFYTAEEFGDTGALLSSTNDREPIAMPTLANPVKDVEPEVAQEPEPKPRPLLEQVDELIGQMDIDAGAELCAKFAKQHKIDGDNIPAWSDANLMGLIVELRKAIGASPDGHGTFVLQSKKS